MNHMFNKNIQIFCRTLLLLLLFPVLAVANALKISVGEDQRIVNLGADGVALSHPVFQQVDALRFEIPFKTVGTVNSGTLEIALIMDQIQVGDEPDTTVLHFKDVSLQSGSEVIATPFVIRGIDRDPDGAGVSVNMAMVSVTNSATLTRDQNGITIDFSGLGQDIANDDNVSSLIKDKVAKPNNGSGNYQYWLLISSSDPLLHSGTNTNLTEYPRLDANGAGVDLNALSFYDSFLAYQSSEPGFPGFFGQFNFENSGMKGAYLLQGQVTIGTSAAGYSPQLPNNWNGVGSAATQGYKLQEQQVNQFPPGLASVPPQSLFEDGIKQLSLTIDDTDTLFSDLTVTVSSDNLNLFPSSSTLRVEKGESNVVLVLDPADHKSGSANITLTVSDGDFDASDSFVVTVEPVNDPPLLEVKTLNLSEGATSSIRGLYLTAFDPDNISSDLTYRLLTTPTNGSVQLSDQDLSEGALWTTADIEAERLKYVHNGGENATDTIKVEVTDGKLASEATLHVAISSVNDRPTLDPIADIQINEDAAEQVIVLTGITAGGGEVQTLTVTATSNSQGVIPQPQVIYIDGSDSAELHFKPAKDRFNSSGVTLSVTVKDEQEGTTTENFKVAVLPVNDPPTIAGTPLTTVWAGEEYRFESIIEDVDLFGGTLQLTPLNLPPWLHFSTGEFWGTPSDGDVAVWSDISLKVKDPQGEVTTLTPFNIEVYAPLSIEGLTADTNGEWTIEIEAGGKLPIQVNGGSGSVQLVSLDDKIVSVSLDNQLLAKKLGTVTVKTMDDFDGTTIDLKVSVVDRIAPIVEADKKGGEYAGSVTVSLISSELSNIYYTRDGTAPSLSSRRYDDSLKIDLEASAKLQFFAVDPSGNQSEIISEVYTVLSDADFDGLPDLWEDKYGFDFLGADESVDDPDNDGFTNVEEYKLGTDPSVSNWKVDLSIDELQHWTGETTNLVIHLKPVAGTKIRSFNLGLKMDGSDLSIGDAYFNDLSIGWRLETSSMGTPQSDEVQISLIAQIDSGSPISGEVQLILPITLSQTASIGHVYSLKWAQSSGAVTSGRERYDVAMTLNDGIISVGTGVSQLYRLYPGWNLISFPVELEGRGFDSFLGIAKGVNSIWKMDDYHWNSFVRNIPPFLNSLSGIYPGNGYFVYHDGDVPDHFSISGPPADTAVVLSKGWNAVGFISEISDIQEFLTNRGAIAIWAYDSENGQWLNFMDGFDPEVNSLKGPLKTGVGYFVKVP